MGKPVNKTHGHAIERDDCRPSMMQPLETRLMYDAAGAADVAMQVDQAASDQVASEAMESDTQQTATGVEAQKKEAEKLFSANENLESDLSGIKEVVIVDTTVEDYQTLVSGLSRDAEVYYIDSEQDGMLQVANILSKYSDLDAIHIITHGDAGELVFGSATIDINNLDQYQEAISAWSAALAESGDVLFYGCNVAEGAEGQAFIDELSVLLSADIAASTDKTGSATSGGDWELEAQALEVGGKIETGIIFDQEAQEQYAFTLGDPPTIEPSSFSTTYNADTGTSVQVAPSIEVAAANPAAGNYIGDVKFGWTAGGQTGDFIEFVDSGVYTYSAATGDILKNGAVVMGTLTNTNDNNRTNYVNAASQIGITFALGASAGGDVTEADVNNIINQFYFGSTQSNNSISTTSRSFLITVFDDDLDQSTATSTIAISVNIPIEPEVIEQTAAVEPIVVEPIYETPLGLVDDPVDSELISQETDPGVGLVSTAQSAEANLISSSQGNNQNRAVELARQQVLSNATQTDRPEQRIDSAIQEDIRTADNTAPLDLSNSAEKNILSDQGSIFLDQEQVPLESNSDNLNDNVVDIPLFEELKRLDTMSDNLLESQSRILQDYLGAEEAALPEELVEPLPTPDAVVKKQKQSQ